MMGTPSYLRQDLQVRNTGDPSDYDDNLPAGPTLETLAVTLRDDLNGARSQIKRILGSANWHDDVVRSLLQLHTDLVAVEEKRLLARVQHSTSVTIPPGVLASGVLTLTGNAGNLETVTIDSKVYTFELALTDVDGHVLIGATTADSLYNLVSAITLGPGAGTRYAASTTLHPTVTATTGAGTTMNTYAKIAGTAQNSIATTDTLAAGSWSNATLIGGAGDVVVLSAAGLEVPTETAAVNAGTAEGTIVVTLAGDVGTFATTVVAGSRPVQPKNLVRIVDASTREPIQGVDGRDIWGLLQAESGVVDGDAFDDTNKQVQISFVKLAADGASLIQADGSDIGGQSVRYYYVLRRGLNNLSEQAFLPEVALDLVGASAMLPPATQIGQVLYSADGSTFTVETPLISLGGGWLVNEDGILLIVG